MIQDTIGKAKRYKTIFDTYNNAIRKKEDTASIMESSEKCVYNGLYKNAAVGKDAILCVLEQTTDPALRRELCTQLEYYETQQQKIRQEMKKNYCYPQEQGTLAKFCSCASIRMHCLGEVNPHQIAKLMVEGTNMGLIQLTQLLNRHPHVDTSLQQQAKATIAHEEAYLNRLKPYL